MVVKQQVVASRTRNVVGQLKCVIRCQPAAPTELTHGAISPGTGNLESAAPDGGAAAPTEFANVSVFPEGAGESELCPKSPPDWPDTQCLIHWESSIKFFVEASSHPAGM